METVKIINSRKQNLAAVIFKPVQKTNKLAILCPGYLDTKDYLHIVRLAEELTKRGFIAVSFDPIGTWESEGDVSEYLTSQYLEDVRSILEYMLGRDSYDQILLGGHSRGAQISILYAARDPRITNVVAIMPSSGPVHGSVREEWERLGFRESERDVPGSDEKKKFIVPFKHALDRDQFDVVADVKKIKGSIVLVSGERDTLVPPKEVQKIYDAANKPKELICIAGIDHDYRYYPEAIEKVNKAILDSLAK